MSKRRIHLKISAILVSHAHIKEDHIHDLRYSFNSKKIQEQKTLGRCPLNPNHQECNLNWFITEHLSQYYAPLIRTLQENIIQRRSHSTKCSKKLSRVHKQHHLKYVLHFQIRRNGLSHKIPIISD